MFNNSLNLYWRKKWSKRMFAIWKISTFCRSTFCRSTFCRSTFCPSPLLSVDNFVGIPHLVTFSNTCFISMAYCILYVSDSSRPAPWQAAWWRPFVLLLHNLRPSVLGLLRIWMPHWMQPRSILLAISMVPFQPRVHHLTLTSIAAFFGTIKSTMLCLYITFFLIPTFERLHIHIYFPKVPNYNPPPPHSYFLISLIEIINISKMADTGRSR